MESVPDFSQLTPLASVAFVLSLAYSRLERTRHSMAIMDAAKKEIRRIGGDHGVLNEYKDREYYKILKGLSEGTTMSKYSSRFQSSSTLISRIYIWLYFQNNSDRKISNAIMVVSLAVIVLGNPPFVYLIRSMATSDLGLAITSIAIVVVSIALLLGLVISLLLILQGEHVLPSAQEVIDLCGSELEAYMRKETPKDSSDSIERI